MKTLLLIMTMGLFLLSFNAEAIRIVKKKGSKVYIQLGDVKAQKGDLYHVYNKYGKKSGLVKITSIRGSRALGRVKGKAGKGWELRFYKSKKHHTSRLKKTSSPTMVGGQIGYQSNSMDISSGIGTSLSGTSFSLMGFYDTAAFPSLYGRFNIGVQSLTAKSSDSCSENGVIENCAVDIMYLGVGGVIRYVFVNKGHMRYWAGVGILAYIPLSKKASALKLDSISTTHSKSINAGVDYYWGENMMLPFELSYGKYLDSLTTKTSVISLKAGVGYKF